MMVTWPATMTVGDGWMGRGRRCKKWPIGCRWIEQAESAGGFWHNMRFFTTPVTSRHACGEPGAAGDRTIFAREDDHGRCVATDVVAAQRLRTATRWSRAVKGTPRRYVQADPVDLAKCLPPLLGCGRIWRDRMGGGHPASNWWPTDVAHERSDATERRSPVFR